MAKKTNKKTDAPEVGKIPSWAKEILGTEKAFETTEEALKKHFALRDNIGDLKIFDFVNKVSGVSKGKQAFATHNINLWE